MGEDLDLDSDPQRLHGKESLIADENEEVGLDKSIAVFIQNVIDIKKIPVAKKYTPLDKVIYIDYEMPISKEVIIEFINKGVSRVPVIRNKNKNEMIGYVRTVDFFKVDLENNLTIKDKVVELHKPVITHPETSVYELFSNFKNGNHLAFITEQHELLQKRIQNPDVLTSRISWEKIYNQDIKIIGIVTLEDILESIIGEDIKDESENRRNKKNNSKNDLFTSNYIVYINFIVKAEDLRIK